VVVGLIGEGQEIYLGEEAGIQQGSDAVSRSGVKWTVHCGGALEAVFMGLDGQFSQRLNLNISLRSHLAVDVQRRGRRF